MLTSLAPEPTPPALQQRLRELTFLEGVVRATAEATDYPQLLRRIVDGATEASGAQVCSLYLWDERDRLLVLTATNGLVQTAVGRVRLALGEGVTGWVAAQGQPLAVRDVRYESRFEWLPGIDQERFTSMLSVPIASRGRILGVLNLQTEAAHAFSEAEIDFAKAIAAHLAGIIGMAAAGHQVSQDLALERSSVAQLVALQRGDSAFAETLKRDFLEPLREAGRITGRLTGQAGWIQPADCRDLAAHLRLLESRLERLIEILGTDRPPR
ncbi:MAG: GAF domain-containing protein [Chloroflexota bacterium]|nr:GAF domain-containing protein [Chloroflexota bacterium]